MKLSAPNVLTWFLATLLGGLGVLIYFGVVVISGVSLSPFWLVTAGFGLLWAGTLFSGL